MENRLGIFINKKDFDLKIFNKTSNSREEKSNYLNIWKNSNSNIKSVIEVYDEILSKEQIKELNHLCKNYQMTFSQKSITTSTKKPALLDDNCKKIYENIWNKYVSFTFFKLDCMNNTYIYDLFYETILPKLECIEDKNVIISRAYFNSHTLGFPGSFHKDGKPLTNSKSNKQQYTVLLFVNDNWNINFSGETGFLINDSIFDTLTYVHSKPGRIVVFSSYTSHKACEISPYSLLTNTKRFVFAYHLYYPNYII